MRHRHVLSAADHGRIEDLLPGCPGRQGGIARENRRSLDAVFHIISIGAARADLPGRLGRDNSQRRRIDRRKPGAAGTRSRRP